MKESHSDVVTLDARSTPAGESHFHSLRTGVELAVARSHNRKAIHSSPGREREQSINPSVSGSPHRLRLRPSSRHTRLKNLADALGSRDSFSAGVGIMKNFFFKKGSSSRQRGRIAHRPRRTSRTHHRGLVIGSFLIGKSATQHLPSGDFLIKLRAKTRGGNFTFTTLRRSISDRAGKMRGFIRSARSD